MSNERASSVTDLQLDAVQLPKGSFLGLLAIMGRPAE
jgi:hypothetical protein